MSDQVAKPPLGVMPAWCWNEQHPHASRDDIRQRIEALAAAIGRYGEAQRGVREEWLDELGRLGVQLERDEPANQVARPITDAERQALNALHRWLHSPFGDDMLIEAAQDFHEQAEMEAPEECPRLDEEERLAYGLAMRGGDGDEELKP